MGKCEHATVRCVGVWNGLCSAGPARRQEPLESGRVRKLLTLRACSSSPGRGQDAVVSAEKRGTREEEEAVAERVDGT